MRCWIGPACLALFKRDVVGLVRNRRESNCALSCGAPLLKFKFGQRAKPIPQFTTNGGLRQCGRTVNLPIVDCWKLENCNTRSKSFCHFVISVISSFRHFVISSCLILWPVCVGQFALAVLQLSVFVREWGRDSIQVSACSRYDVMMFDVVCMYVWCEQSGYYRVNIISVKRLS